MEKTAVSNSNLTLNNRNEMTITGIKKVKTTEQNQVVAALDNSLIVITGSNLSVQNLSIREGLLELSGNVDGIRYTSSHSKKFSVKNMFK